MQGHDDFLERTGTDYLSLRF